jgi:hypothetical protein
MVLEDEELCVVQRRLYVGLGTTETSSAEVDVRMRAFWKECLHPRSHQNLKRVMDEERENAS